MAQTGGKGQRAPPLTVSVLSAGTCTTTGSKAWEPTALMGCTAWKPCESPLFFSILKSFVCSPPPAVPAGKSLTAHPLLTTHWGQQQSCFRHQPSKQMPKARCFMADGRLGFPPASVQAGPAVLLLRRGLHMWVESVRGLWGPGHKSWCNPESLHACPAQGGLHLLTNTPGPKAS